NWVDQQTGDLVESRDGPGHSLALDRCDDPDAMRSVRRQAATAAASALLQATLVPGASSDKLARADAVITQYTTMQAGCTYANKWCDAPEAALPNTLACACTFGAAPASSPLGWLVPLGLVALLLVRRRVRALMMMALLFTGTAAHGQTTAAPRVDASANGGAASDPAVVNAPLAAPPGAGTVEPGRQTATPTRAEIADVRAKKKLGPRFGAQLTLGGAVDRAAAQVALGLRFRIDERWQVGLDAEYNPFFSIDGHDARPGALNVYFVGVRRYPMLWNRVNLRTTVQAGISSLLFDLYGAPAGSVGPYVGVSLLGVDFDLGHALRLVVDPTNIALPVPHLSGQPFYYLQYRLTVALAFGA
ncbi:MAG TPA: hypothetical protein VIA18_11570, partial [Polyangia bacterium]|nr:hypothetical protein [Polyangia bacterium]